MEPDSAVEVTSPLGINRVFRIRKREGHWRVLKVFGSRRAALIEKRALEILAGWRLAPTLHAVHEGEQIALELELLTGRAVPLGSLQAKQIGLRLAEMHNCPNSVWGDLGDPCLD